MQSLDIPPIDPGMLGGDTFVPCHVKQLPPDRLIEASRTAVAVNPLNAVTVASASARALANILPPEHIAILTKKHFAPGATITVGFLESTPAELRDKIIDTANDWNRRGANVRFAWSQTDPMIRVTREGEGYWSYLGTDLLSIPAGQPTLCLQAFSLSTPQSEYNRVVKHEFAHSLGAPHEHMRSGVVARLNVARTIAYFQATQGWSAEMVKQQVLTPLDESSLMGTPVDVNSIMAYQLPSSITVDGQPIPGGLDIDDSDAAWMAKIYPGLTPAPPAPPGPGPAKPAAHRVRGYIGLTPQKFPRKLVVYVPNPAGGEIGYEYIGAFAASRTFPDSIMFDGEGERV
jgi:hypothetical protein